MTDIELIREAADIIGREGLWTYGKVSALCDQADRMEAKSRPVPDNVISGACYDLMGYLTTRRTRLCLSTWDNSSPAVDALIDWFKSRGIKGENALVENWQDFTRPASDEVERFKALCVRNLLQDNARITSLEAQLSAIRQAVAKVKAGGSTIAFFATLYELDAINPAPPAPKEG